jgi:mono/diheme cytochrome c family protein
MFKPETYNLTKNFFCFSFVSLSLIIGSIFPGEILAGATKQDKLVKINSSDDVDNIDEDLSEEMVGNCPEKRVIKNAPTEYLEKVNPLRKEPRNLKKGKVLYRIKAKRACKFCHGMEGLGDGSMSDLQPMPPRNFTCRNYMNKIKDGDLFWVIKEGISDSGMPSYKHLSDKKIWQLIHYIRTFSNLNEFK